MQGGVPQLKDVENDVEQNYFEAKAGPAMRQYLAQMRDESAIYIKPGYDDSAATAAEKHPTITFSAYTPPTAKKKTEGGADPLPRDDTHLPAEVRARGDRRYGDRNCGRTTCKGEHNQDR